MLYYKEIFALIFWRFNYAAKHTNLPEKADMQKIEDFVYSVNEKIIRGEVK